MTEPEHELLWVFGQLMDKLLARAQEGHDIPPALKYRLEGMMDAARICGLASEGELRALYAQRYETRMSLSLASALGGDWEKEYPFPTLPLYTKRAPVVPTTADK